MRSTLASALGSAVTTFIWVYIASLLNLPPWAGFLGWTTYFMTGTDAEGMKKSAAALVFGAFMAFLYVSVDSMIPSSGYLVSTLLVALMAFIISMAGATNILQLVAVSFVGANIYFASGVLWISIVLPLVGLLILGPVSSYFSSLFEKLLIK
ncbi:DUF1097 domain-containing protein [Aerococcaceae bacterium DSM 111176]|nr:DUF1097 domain-containing protein [Aerococcaceae bacterium DSM 111176]